MPIVEPLTVETALNWKFGWLVLSFTKVVKNGQGNIVWQFLSIASGAILIVFFVWDRVVTAIRFFKGYSAKQVLFGDAPHRLQVTEDEWEERKRRWRRFFRR